MKPIINKTYKFIELSDAPIAIGNKEFLVLNFVESVTSRLSRTRYLIRFQIGRSISEIFISEDVWNRSVRVIDGEWIAEDRLYTVSITSLNTAFDISTRLYDTLLTLRHAPFYVQVVERVAGKVKFRVGSMYAFCTTVDMFNKIFTPYEMDSKPDTTVSVSFEFKNDQDRLDAIKFLEGMKVK